MTTPPQPLDIVTVAVAIASVLFGARMAAIVGPYAVIFIGAVVGSVYSATGRASSGKLSALGYCALMVLLSVSITVPAAEILAPYIRVSEPRHLFFVVSAGISAVGDKWPGVILWAWGLLQKMAERKAGGQP